MKITIFKKRQIYTLLLCALTIAVLTGCGKKETADKTSKTSSTDSETQSKALTKEELEQWTKYVNNNENNGFLLSFYDRPEQIDLEELFYSGCGLEQEELSPEETEEYLKLIEMDEIYTSVIRITGTQIESVLQQRLGLTLSDMEKPLDWCYLEKSDAYVVQHGDTNAQIFTCIAGVQKDDQVILDCLSEMTEETCRVTLKQSKEKDVWMFVSNEAIIENSFEDSIFISDEAYMDVVSRLGEKNALQLRTFAENYQQWIPEDMAPGSIDFAIYDLDGDGQLELLCTQSQGTGLFACNSFYQADVSNGQVYELNQQTSEENLAFEIGQTSPNTQANVYTDSQGRVFYMASDYEKSGLQFSSHTDGYYYLEDKTVVSEAIRTCTQECNDNNEWIYTYYLPNQENPVTEKEWKTAYQTFQKGKTAIDSSICWKSLYEDEIAEKKVQSWFLLLAESLEQAVLPVR